VSERTGVSPASVPLDPTAPTPLALAAVEATPVPFPDDVEVAVVSHNGRATLPRLIDCVRAAGAPDDRIAIYDIGSTDGTVEWLARDHPRVVARRFNDNVGPNPGRNWAIRAATRPFVLLLDADAFIHADAPAHLRRALDPGAAVGAVASVIVHAHDPSRVQYAGGGLHFICEAVSPYVDLPLVHRGSNRLDIGAAPGMALLIDVNAARDCGLFDERYFLGKDDGDFCHRLRMSGFRLVEEPRAVCEHQSRPRSAWLFPFQIRNRWHFMLKNYEARTLIVLAPALLVHELLQFGMLVAKGHLAAWWKALQGLRGWLPSLGEDRRAIQSRRKVRDRDLLTAAPLIVRSDMVGGGGGQFLKRAYDGWLRGYWSVAIHLLS
jgi:GT2 family glycosyltransferase